VIPNIARWGHSDPISSPKAGSKAKRSDLLISNPKVKAKFYFCANY
jgi:hypothetical protein